MLLGLVVGGFFLPHAHAQTWESCFDEANPPTCSAEEGILVDDSFDAQPACAMLDMEFLWGIQFHTSYHAKALSVIPADTELCDQVRRAYHLCYWCTPNIESHDYCFFTSCEEPEEIDETVDLNATCTELDALFVKDEFPATMDLCYRAEQAKHICSSFCQHKPDYLGADSTRRKKSLAWTSRAAAILSFIGACYILWDVLSKRKNRVACYHQILVGMACFDIATAVAWSLSTLPIPDDQGFYIEGAAGNDATCTAQGFFVQLGLTSVFYNVSLALYYVLVIVYNWRDCALKKIRVLLHGLPLLVGFGLAFGGIPLYEWNEYVCHLEPAPADSSWKAFLFVVTPISFSVLFITACMLIVYVSVRRKSKASRKWSIGFGTSGEMERRVFWQALLYTLSFYVTWPIILLVYADSVDIKVNNFWFSLLVAFVAPLQGFSNFLVYVRPRALEIKQFARASRKISAIFSTAFGRKDSSEDPDTSSSTVDPSVLIATRPDDTTPAVTEVGTA